MRCQFESYPPPDIHWIKMERTVQDRDGRVLAVDVDNGVNDITMKQLGPTLFESVLSVNLFEEKKRIGSMGNHFI